MHQTLSQLSYALVKGHPPLTTLRIMKSKKVSWKGWDVSLNVLGASHAVQIKRDCVAFTEVLACLPLDTGGWVDQNDIMLLSQVNNSWESPFQIGGLHLRMKIIPISLGNDALHGSYDVENMLQMPFPLDAPLTGNAITRIGWSIDNDHLSIETIHSYPEESKAVRTFTVYQEAL